MEETLLQLHIVPLKHSNKLDKFFTIAQKNHQNLLFALKADLRWSQDGHWWIYPHKYLQETSTGKGYLEHKNHQYLSQIKFLNSEEKLLSFNKFLDHFSHLPLLLVLHTDQVSSLEKTKSAVTKTLLKRQFDDSNIKSKYSNTTAQTTFFLALWPD